MANSNKRYRILRPLKDSYRNPIWHALGGTPYKAHQSEAEMSNHDSDEDEGDIEWKGKQASYEVVNGLLYLNAKLKAPMKLMLGRDTKDQAKWMLKELIAEMAIESARRP